MFDPQDDPLAYMNLLANSKTVRFIVPTVNWSDTRHALSERFSAVSDGDFTVLLGREDRLSDDHAEFVVYTNDAAILADAATVGRTQQ